MAKRIAVTSLNASTIDILNVIRANASLEYQQLVPEITTANEIPKVGEIIYGTPALANQFINALVNRIASVRVKSATFNNAYAELKKGYLEFGETVEEVFVSIAKAQVYTPEKGAEREFKRNLPDVRSAFHVMNWRVMYPVTIQDEDLRLAFMSIDGVQDLIAKIVDSLYTAVEYDEYLLFKYLLIKAISHGKMHPVSIKAGNLNDAGTKFRGMSNQLIFLSDKYNASGVKTSTPKENQYIFMDSMFNATYDVNVLASAFNMDKAEFEGKLKLIDDWTTFDNERFEEIRKESDTLEEVTNEELALLKDVKAVLVDSDWFQIYDNNIKFTEVYVSSGLYWNYFLHTWKTISSSPFANAIVFVEGADVPALPQTITVEITNKSIGENATVFTLEAQEDTPALTGGNVEYIQNQTATQNGIAIHKYGAVIFPADKDTALTLTMNVENNLYTAQTTLSKANEVGETIIFSK